ncbi:NRDE family protein [Alteromonas pelagimontana]|uniref:NRDE family protein n=1 Tax=Alteromonas pelagimontana TaxID=1858656 RepID=A0A6M4M9T7_9ALTE|nr:NRDE family protein [Alteromonas pelagimontana]QJR79405.1 NRDE family protein [Alteromonas pelagimontana]
MCILFIAYQQREDYPLIIAANRDEFHARPTQHSHIWHDVPQIFAGRDLQAGGTWMGVTRSGRIAALTNIRESGKNAAEKTTRGRLVKNFLASQCDADSYTQELKSSARQYNGFNLLYGDWRELQVFSNRQGRVQKLDSGIYGLSNDDLNSPWPKVTRGMSALKQYCQKTDFFDEEMLFELLRNKEQAQDEVLPDTGVGYEWEKILSSIYINTPQYGTRSSTLLLIQANGHASWKERTFNSQGEQTHDITAHFQFAS